MPVVGKLGSGRIRIWLGCVQTPKTSVLSSKRMNFTLAEVTMADIPQIMFELLVPCFNPELSDRYVWGGASLKNQRTNYKRKPQAAPIPNRASKLLFAVS